MTIKEDPVKSPEPEIYVSPAPFAPSAPPAIPVVQATVVETKPPVASAPGAASATYPRTRSKTPYVHNKPCPNCGNDGKGKTTILTSKISDTGWLLCLLVACFAWPCCWVPLVLVRLLCRFLFVWGRIPFFPTLFFVTV